MVCYQGEAIGMDNPSFCYAHQFLCQSSLALLWTCNTNWYKICYYNIEWSMYDNRECLMYYNRDCSMYYNREFAMYYNKECLMYYNRDCLMYYNRVFNILQ